MAVSPTASDKEGVTPDQVGEPPSFKRGVIGIRNLRIVLYWICRGLVIGSLRAWFRPRVQGREKVPLSGPVIIAPVHRSFIDFAFSGVVTRRMLYFMAKEELWKIGWFGRLLEFLGVFPVHRAGTDRESVRRAQEILRKNQVLVMFPEGSRRSGAQVSELLEGVAFLAARTGAVIVPVGIAGSEQAMPKGAKFPKPIRITVSVGEPITTPDHEPTKRVPRSQIHQLTEQLRAHLQAAYDNAAR